MKLNLITLMILLVLSLCAIAQTKEQIILQLEDQLVKARVANDTATMEKLMADDWRFYGQFES